MNSLMKKIILISTAVAFVFSMTVYVMQQSELAQKYKAGIESAENGDYEKAAFIISNIGEYRDSEDRLEEYKNELDYQKADTLMKEEKYEEAIQIYTRLNSEGGGYKESKDLQDFADYQRAIALAEQGQLSVAYEGFKRLPSSYADVADRITELRYALNITDKWYCKEHAIDLDIHARVSEENITYLEAEISDRNGFLMGTEHNKLTGSDLVLIEDRFTWNLLGNDTKYIVVLEDNKIKIGKQPLVNKEYIVTFTRKLENYNSIDGDIDRAVHAKVDSAM